MVVLAIHRHESAMGVHVSPIPKPLSPSSPLHPSGLSQGIGFQCRVSCIKLGLAIYFTYDNIHVSMLFSQIIPPSPSPTESKSLFFTSVSFAVSHMIPPLPSPTESKSLFFTSMSLADSHMGHCYHLSKFHIYALICHIGVFLSK